MSCSDVRIHHLYSCRISDRYVKIRSNYVSKEKAIRHKKQHRALFLFPFWQWLARTRTEHRLPLCHASSSVFLAQALFSVFIHRLTSFTCRLQFTMSRQLALPPFLKNPFVIVMSKNCMLS